MFRYVSRSDTIKPEDIGTVYNLIEQAVEATDFEGKSTDEIFGEIYTRFRTEISLYGGRHDTLRFLRHGLKTLDRASAGKELNAIINELYNDKLNRTNSLEDLELMTVIMHDCLEDAKNIDKQSNEVMLTLKQISEDLDGEK